MTSFEEVIQEFPFSMTGNKLKPGFLDVKNKAENYPALCATIENRSMNNCKGVATSPFIAPNREQQKPASKNLHFPQFSLKRFYINGNYHHKLIFFS